MITTARTNLIPFTEDHFRAIFQNDNLTLGRLLEIEPPESWTEFGAAEGAITAFYDIFKSLNNDNRWGSYFIVSKNEKILPGTCCFKGKPDINNMVEVGYEINQKYQDKGLATEITKALMNFAFKQNVLGVIAHTLAEENASNKILKNCGFKFETEINDPEDGLIWKWVCVK